MAIVKVRDTGHRTCNGLASDAASFASLPAAGNSVFVLISIWDFVVSAGQVTDNQSNTYGSDIWKTYSITNDPNVGIHSDIDIGSPSGTFTITVNPPNGADYWEWIGVEFSGLADASVLDQTASGGGSNTAPTCTGSTTTQADELWLGVCGVTDENSADIQADLMAGWTALGLQINPATTISHMSAYKIVSATGTLTYNAGTIRSLTTPATHGWAIAAASYKMAAAAAGIIHILDRQYRARRT